MSWKINIENVAGIRQGVGRLEPGVNAVRASNWQGKSSFLAAIRAVMGVESTLTVGEDTGRVELRSDNGTYEVDLSRTDGIVSVSGDPYLDEEYDRVCADLFAFLSGDNEVRQAVREDGDLEAVLTRPLDFEDIDRKIRDRREERDRVDRELKGAQETAERRRGLERQVDSLESSLEELHEREERLAPADGESAAKNREELSELRAERERVLSLIERLENSVDRTEKKLEDTHAELTELSVPEDPQLDSEIATERDAIEDKERELELLQSLYSVTERFLKEEKLGILGKVDHGLMGDMFECPICASEADEAAVRERLDTLGDRVVDRREQIAEHEQRVEELTEQREALRDARRRQQDLEAEVTSLEANIADRKESLEGARERLEVIDGQVAALESEADEAYEELTDMRSERKYTETELEEAREELEAAERAVEQVHTLEAHREQLVEEITELRQRKERLREELREEFDDAIRQLVETFDTSFEHARLTAGFDLVVARDGHEVGRDALSEGELELLGIVTALAGFETYNVDNITPVILLDEVGALDDRNLRQLTAYLSNRSRFLVVTAYPENTGFEDHEISPGAWDVVPPASVRAGPS